MNRAQQELPFTIILPGYLPSALTVGPDIQGPIKGASSDENVRILVRYAGENYYMLEIWQINHTYTMLPNSISDYSYLDIYDVQVMEVKDEQRKIDYYWIQNNMAFEVTAWKYDHKEAVKIIESMIEQGVKD